MPPLIGITCSIEAALPSARAVAALAYARAVAAAGGTPLLLPPLPECLGDHLGACDAFVLTGGDDPSTEPFGAPTHPKATTVDPLRQEYETRLLRQLADERPDTPVLGICLGMQMMALVAGGRLDQHLPESTPSAPMHWDQTHLVLTAHVKTPFADGPVASKHRQAVTDPGILDVLAHAPDGVIEAVGDFTRRFYVGVQWHPERTPSAETGQALFHALIGAVR
ncbi:MAG: gamma-glutamyl-gamma-aminobutyrate hydrolase family protein [Phycisphaeraceae bacterium]|nr:gamma-glutamyl-gamma-aminobutyrate hydrolase family protein [Phycisphaeraceae bacterium]